METIKRFLQDDSGISATEYVVLAALITGWHSDCGNRCGNCPGGFLQ